MNFTNLIVWALGIVTVWGAGIHVDEIYISILKAQAKLIYEARTETWRSPNFLNVRNVEKNKK